MEVDKPWSCHLEPSFEQCDGPLAHAKPLAPQMASFFFFRLATVSGHYSKYHILYEESNIFLGRQLCIQSNNYLQFSLWLIRSFSGQMM